MNRGQRFVEALHKKSVVQDMAMTFSPAQFDGYLRMCGVKMTEQQKPTVKESLTVPTTEDSSVVRLHPDGMPVGATPASDARGTLDAWRSEVEEQERRARRAEAACAGYHFELHKQCFLTEKAEARIAELEREVAWLRSGGDLKMKKNGGGLPWWEEVFEHLASKPPEDGKPQ